MSRTLQVTSFADLVRASSNYIPAHSKNGKNISQRLNVGAFMNIASSANEGKGRHEVIQLTAWGKAADVLAICLTPGKTFSCIADMHVYEGRVFVNTGTKENPDYQPVTYKGQPVMTDKISFTIRQFSLGADSHKHIMNEIQGGFRGMNWWMQGHPDYEAFRNLLKARMTTQFNPQLKKFGFADVRLPEGAGIGAYIQGQSVDRNEQPVATSMTDPAAIVGAGYGNAVNADAVKAAFSGGAQPAATVQPASPTVESLFPGAKPAENGAVNGVAFTPNGV